jgi:hypothetical protein
MLCKIINTHVSELAKLSLSVNNISFIIAEIINIIFLII